MQPLARLLAVALAPFGADGASLFRLTSLVARALRLSSHLTALLTADLRTGLPSLLRTGLLPNLLARLLTSLLPGLLA